MPFDSYVADMKPAILNPPFNARQIANSAIAIEWRSFVWFVLMVPPHDGRSLMGYGSSVMGIIKKNRAFHE